MPNRAQQSDRFVMLVAGSHDVAGGVVETLRSSGKYDVRTAATAEQALRRHASFRPDLVLLDATVADFDAFAVCARIRASRAGAFVPIVLLLSDGADESVIERGLACGATDFVSIPFSSALFAHRIDHLVQSNRRSLDLDASSSRLARASHLARLVQWQFDVEARTFRWSESAQEIFAGVTGEGTVHDTLLALVHTSDRNRVAESLSQPESRNLEYRMALPGGAERVVRQDTRTEVDSATGRPCLVGTMQDVTELRAAERQVTKLAYYDELTELPNRAHVCRLLEAALSEAKHRGQRVAVISLDLDLFRRVNDQFGHVLGNVVLQEVASRLRAVVSEGRRFRTCSEATVARLGGDEFAVVLRDVRDDDDAPSFFRVVAARLAEPYLVQDAQVVLSCSAGIASFPANGADVDTLLMRADAAMHAAKDRGRGGVQIFAAELEQRQQRRLEVERRLRTVLASGSGLELHYQPKVESPSGRVAGVEALLRWAPDPAGPISPAELVAVAEETGLIVELDDWVVRTACEQASQWCLRGPRPIHVAVNISARRFGSADFAEKVAAVLAATGLSPELLELEITEGVMMCEPAATSRTLARLRLLGVRLSLDDFGTGYSSLAYLTRFPIDTLKIDRSFVTEIGVTSKSEAIIGAIVALARSLDIEIVAEGVETEAQRAFLERFGRIQIQGWLFSKALPPEKAAAWIVEHEEARTPAYQATG